MRLLILTVAELVEWNVFSNWTFYEKAIQIDLKFEINYPSK
jgi:hypothetical protein